MPLSVIYHRARKSHPGVALRFTKLAAAVVALLTAACGPRAHIPPHPVVVPDAVDAADPLAIRARALAPVLYLQADESFRLERVVAVVHPELPLIAYHLLWRDDVHGAWIPFTKPTDEEEVWIEYDSTGAPVELWTFWHGKLLHTDWRGRGQVAIDVQWGKHGSLPHGTRLGDLPFLQRMPLFWLGTWIGLPDIWLGNLSRRGPWCFCHGYERYLAFDRPLLLTGRISAVVKARHAEPALSAVFGKPYSKKIEWPPEALARLSHDSTASAATVPP